MKPILLFVLPAFLLLPCSAMTRRTGDMITVAQEETIEDSLFAAGETVRVEGNVNGDVIAFSRNVVVRGQIKGNLYTAARDVEITGRIDGGLISFSRQILLDGETTGNAYAFAQTVRTAPRGKIGGDLSAFGQDLELEGSVNRDAQVFGNHAVFSGEIGRDARFRGDSMEIRNAARVHGNVTAYVDDEEDVQIAPGAQIAGGALRLRERESPAGFMAAFAFYGLWFAAAYVTGLVVLMVRPGPFLNAADAVSYGWRTFLLGLLVLIATPIALGIIGITLVGLPIALIGLAGYAIALFLAGLVVSAAVGEYLVPTRSRALALFLGLLVVMAFSLIPYGIGMFVRMIVTCLGLGGLAWGIHRIPRARRAMEPIGHPLTHGV